LVLRGAAVAERPVVAVESLWRVTIAAAGVAATTLATSVETRSFVVPYMCFVDLIVPPVDAARDVERTSPVLFPCCRREDFSVAATAVLLRGI
jgi:hypothetical protein